ncbi:MAG: copper oxidase [Chloroflexi bacterium B3_Chlor]|nr:MAG: copper oxidase [Chloroflexi bacterium B3_Chlor]
MWGYAPGNGPFQYPGPVLCVNQEDTVTVVLHNTLSEDVSIVFPGQADVLADGAPSQPVYDDGNLLSLTKAAAPGGSVTYSFVASEPGTYLYHSGTDPDKQVQMGLAGALVVRPGLGPDYAYDSADTRFNSDAEFLLVLSEIDPVMHQAVEQGQPFDMTQYHPRYWLINGRGFPDTLAPNYASWLPDQPYSALERIHPYDPVSNPLPMLTRYLSTGSFDYPFHPHGAHGRVIARDGRLLRGAGGEDLSYEKFTVTIGPGQTLDTLYTWGDTHAGLGYDIYGHAPGDPMQPGEYAPDHGKPLPVTIPQEQDQTMGMYYSGSPFLGVMEPMLPGMMTYNQCGENYLIAHSHALHMIVAWDVLMSGMATYIRIDPPLPNMCP